MVVEVSEEDEEQRNRVRTRRNTGCEIKRKIRVYKQQLLLKDKVLSVSREEIDELRKLVSGTETKVNKMGGKVDNS